MTAVAAGLSGLFAALVASRLVGRRSPTGPVSDGRLRAWLSQSDLEISPARFLGLIAGAALGTFVMLYAITGVVAISLPPALGAASLPFLVHDRRRRKRLQGTVAAWPDGLRDLSASLSSGMSLARALERLADQGPEALREPFGGYAAMARAVGVGAALDAVRERFADPTSDRVIEVLRMANERGGSGIPSVLADLADATTSDLWAADQLRSEVLEQKINARAVFVLPWLVLVFLNATPGDFRDFYSSPGGLIVVLIGAVISGGGVLLAERLGREQVEERVLGGDR